MKLYFLRHGETALNVQRKYYGATDVGLTNNGKAQIREVSKQIGSKNINRIVVSGLKRTIESANIIIEQNNLQSSMLESYTQLNERNFGDWETLNADEVEQRFPEDWKAFIQQPFNTTPRNGEPYSKFQNRVLAQFEKLVHSAQDSDIILFIGHQGVLREIISHYFELETNYWDINISSHSLLEYEI